jgi:hypothetical protein
MTIFDLIFVSLFLVSVMTFSTAAITRMRGRGKNALRILKLWVMSAAVYIGIVAVVALATPRRIVPIGEARCFDDWCIAVVHADRKAAHDGVIYTVTLRLSSRAHRVEQREKGVHVYLTDAKGRRFDPAPAPAAIPLDVRLLPGEADETERSFTVPIDPRDIGLVVAHEGSFCFPGCFIIGEDGNPLRKPAVVPLPVQ